MAVSLGGEMSEQNKLSVFIIAKHGLAGAYLLQSLSPEYGNHTTVCDELPQTNGTHGCIVFVVDSASAFPPVGECVLELQSRFPNARLIVIDGPQTTEEVLRLVRLGVHGFVEYSRVTTALCEAVRAVAEGRFWFPNDILQAYVRLTTRPDRSRHDGLTVTRRELEVLELLKSRLSNKEIANTLGIRESTVKYHVSNLFEKFHVANRHELIRKRKLPRIWDQLSDPVQFRPQRAVGC